MPSVSFILIQFGYFCDKLCTIAITLITITCNSCSISILTVISYYACRCRYFWSKEEIEHLCYILRNLACTYFSLLIRISYFRANRWSTICDFASPSWKIGITLRYHDLKVLIKLSFSTITRIMLGVCRFFLKMLMRFLDYRYYGKAA